MENRDVLSRLEEVEAENAVLREDLDDAVRSLRFEDRGWDLIGSIVTGEKTDGLNLSQVKEISDKIRPYVVAGDLMKRGVDLHTGYVWNRGLHIEGVDKKGRGAPSRLRNFYSNTTNKESLFSPFAHSELQKARYTDGNIFLLCDPAKGTVNRIPLKEITGIYTNPDFPEQVWAYRRTWNPDAEATEPVNRWYYTKRFTGSRKTTFTYNGTDEKVEKGVIVDARFNRQTGWPLGIPDAAAALPWRKAYAEFMKYGQVVSESLAKILYKVTGAKSKAGAANVAVKMGGMQGHGNGVTTGEGQDLEAVRTAGRGYEFKSGDRIAAMVAASLNVPNVELLSDSSAAGGSYGAAATLTPSTRNSMKIIQDEWLFLFNEVFDAFNLDVPKIWFDPIDAPDPYRAAQQAKLLSDGLSDEEYRGVVLDQLDIPGDPTKIPPLLAARNATQSTTGNGVQAASPGQGQSNGTGGVGSTAANDLRSDTLTNSMLFDLDRFEHLIERFERAKNSE